MQSQTPSNRIFTMRITCFYAVFFLSTLLISCQDTQHEILEMRVSDHKEIGYGFIGPRSLFLIQVEDEIGGEEWDRTFGIENFDYEWGYTYNILVEKKYYDEPVMDAPSFRYIFIKQLSKEKIDAGTRFELILQRTYDDGTVEQFWEGSKQNGVSILGTKSFDCADFCDELMKMRESYRSLKGTFEHVGEGEVRLVDLKNPETDEGAP